MFEPFVVNKYADSPWPQSLKPIGEGTFEKEPFSEWWPRNGGDLSNLNPQICEQWIYRHWLHSPWSFLPLDRLIWSTVNLETEILLKTVHRVFADQLDPEYDFKAFQGHNGRKLPTALDLDDGTWSYPILVLNTPSGIVFKTGDISETMMDCRYALVEGHQRHRYLNALHHRGIKNGPHDVFVLSFI